MNFRAFEIHTLGGLFVDQIKGNEKRLVSAFCISVAFLFHRTDGYRRGTLFGMILQDNVAAGDRHYVYFGRWTKVAADVTFRCTPACWNLWTNQQPVVNLKATEN